MKLLIFTLLSLILTHGFGQTQKITPDDNQPRILQVNQTSLHVDLNLDPYHGKVMGKASLDFVNLTPQLDSLWLDGVAMKITEMKNNDKSLTFKTFEKGIAVFFNPSLKLHERVKLNYSYQASPKRGMYFIGWNDPQSKAPKQIWTQGQGIDNRHWLPHVDTQNDKLKTSIGVYFDNNYEVISNGVLTESKAIKGQKYWRYQMEKEQSSYLIMLAIGDYKVLSQQSKSGIELSNYYYPEFEERNRWTYFKNQEIFDFLETEIGVPYPWQNYKQVPVRDFQHGAMENTTATIFGDFYCVDSISFNDDPYVRVNAHELAHQWFGNYVTSYGAHDHWLHEGFATYYSWLAEEMVFGINRVDEIKVVSQKNINHADENDKFPLAHSKAGSSRFYDKGAWVLYMLKNKIGKTAFDQGIKIYLTKNAYQLVKTNDFKAAMEEASGEDLTVFFNQWVHRIGLPKIKAEIIYTKEANNVSISITQKQAISSDNPVYNLMVPIVVKTDKERYEYKLDMRNHSKVFSLAFGKKEKLEYIMVDPNHTLLVNWQWVIPREYLIQYIVHPEAGLQTVYLFEALGVFQKEDTKWIEKIDYAQWSETMQSAFMQWIVPHQEQLDKKWFKQILKTSKRNAKLVFLRSSAAISNDFKTETEAWLDAPSYEVQAEAMVKLCLSFKTEMPHYLEKMDGVYGTRGNNVRNYWLLLSVLNGHQNSMVEWCQMLGQSYDFMTRINAIELFGATGYYLDNNVCGLLLQATFQGNRRLRNTARNYLKECWKDQEKQKIILAHLKKEEHSYNPFQQEMVRNMFNLKLEETD